MLKKIFALTSAATILASAAYAGENCCAAKSASAKSTSAATKSCCAAKAKQASGTKSAMACCAKDAKVATVKATKSTKVKRTEVRLCPMTGGPAMGKGGGTQVVGAYNVHFCCAGCKPAFNKLSKAEQQKKIQAALKKQNAAKKAA